ncbi:MAG: endolytic transglycosylase MltG [Bacillota bacterium]
MKKSGIIFFIIIIIITGILRINFLLSPVDRNNDNQVSIKINSGSSSIEIADKLIDKGLVRSRLLFIFVINFYGIDDKLQAGYYKFSYSDSLRQIIYDILRGKIATFKVSVPEGYNVEDIAARLEEVTPYHKEDFLDIAKKTEMVSSIVELPDSDNRKYPVEGFLYPDTYNIPLEYGPEKIIKEMIDQFKSKWKDELENYVSESEKKLDLDLYDYVIIASLIEKEAKLEQEKSIISAVIHNRMEQDMPLQIDASVQYILSEWKDRLMYNDLEEESPYNTYLFKGLPQGPICSPGSKSLKAALKPSDDDYLFYFALDDGSHVFTHTYREHIDKQNQIQKEDIE